MQINLLFHIGVIVIPLYQSSPGLKAFLVETARKSKEERKTSKLHNRRKLPPIFLKQEQDCLLEFFIVFKPKNKKKTSNREMRS